MSSDEAERLREAEKTKHGENLCPHNQFVEYLISKNGDSTGYLVCGECGSVFPDPLK